MDRARAWRSVASGRLVEIGQVAIPGNIGRPLVWFSRWRTVISGGCLGVRHAEPGQVALDGGIQLDLAGFDELHHGQGGERFGQGADEEGRLRGWRFAARSGPAKAAQVHDLVAFDDGE